MLTRLVLGCGSIGHAVVSHVRDLPGELLVVSESEQRVDSLRGENVPAELADPADPDVLRSLLADVDVVVVAGEEPLANERAAIAAREAYPDAMLIAYTGAEPAPASRETIEDLADHVVDPGVAAASFLLERAGDAGVRMRQLRGLLRRLDGPLAVVTHDNPDPDAIASAIALRRIAAATGREAEVCYYGSITHQENRAFVNLLEFDLRRLEPDEGLEEFGAVALVDHSRPGVNDQLPEDTPIDIVIDHHPPRAPIDAQFVDLRSHVGATSTLLVEYLRLFGVEPDERVATGLLFGIRVDTDAFRRQVAPADFEAAAFLLPHANVGTLERIEGPSVSPETLDTLARAIGNRQVRGSVLTSCVGRVTDRDALAQAADRLLNLASVTTTLVYGVREGVVYMSGRTRGTDLDLGETLREGFGQIGSAGGHADMAGGQVTLGILEAIEDDTESLIDMVEAMVNDRFFTALQERPDWEPADLYVDTGLDYLVGEDGLEVPPEYLREPLGEAEAPEDEDEEREDLAVNEAGEDGSDTG